MSKTLHHLKTELMYIKKSKPHIPPTMALDNFIKKGTNITLYNEDGADQRIKSTFQKPPSRSNDSGIGNKHSSSTNTETRTTNKTNSTTLEHVEANDNRAIKETNQKTVSTLKKNTKPRTIVTNSISTNVLKRSEQSGTAKTSSTESGDISAYKKLVLFLEEVCSFRGNITFSR